MGTTAQSRMHPNKRQHTTLTVCNDIVWCILCTTHTYIPIWSTHGLGRTVSDLISWTHSPGHTATDSWPQLYWLMHLVVYGTQSLTPGRGRRSTGTQSREDVYQATVTYW
jgi:hypothetical protein